MTQQLALRASHAGESPFLLSTTGERAARLYAGLERLRRLEIEMTYQLVRILDESEPDPDLEPSLCIMNNATARDLAGEPDLEEQCEGGGADDGCEDEGAQCDDEGFDCDREPEESDVAVMYFNQHYPERDHDGPVLRDGRLADGSRGAARTIRPRHRPHDLG